MNQKETYDELIDQGIHYAAEGRLTEAQQAFEQAQEEKPDGYEVYANLGALAQLVGDHPKALGYFEQALQLSPSHVNTLYNKGISFAALKQYEDAMAVYDQVLELDPAYTKAFMAKGYALMQLKEDKQARQLFESFLQMAEPDEEALKEQVQIWLKAMVGAETQEIHFDLLESASTAMKAGDGQSALQFLNQYLDIYPLDHMVLVQRAYVHAQLNQREAASVDSQMAEKLAPEDAWVYYFQALMEKVYERPKAALTLLQRAEQLDPELWDIYSLRAALSENTDEQFQLYSKAIMLNPNSATPYFERGRIFQERGEMLEALSDYSRALQIEPNRTELYQKIDDILAYLEDQIAIQAGDPAPHAQRAQAFMRLERFEDALSDWQAALKIQPTNPLLIRGMSTALIHSGQSTRAWELITNYLNKEEPVAELLLERARISMMLMRNEEAENDLIEALNLDASLSEAHYLKGKVHQSREEGLEAETHFHQALQMGLELPDLYHHLGLREIEKENIAKSLQYLDKGIELGINADLLMDAAHVADSVGKRKQSLAYLEKLLSHFPNEIEAWRLQASFQQEAGEKEKALQSWQAVGQLNPLELAPWRHSMKLAYELEKWEVALESASRLFSSGQQELDCLKIRAISYYHLEKKKLAKRDLMGFLMQSMEIDQEQLAGIDFSTENQHVLNESEQKIWDELREITLPQKKKKKPWWKLGR